MTAQPDAQQAAPATFLQAQDFMEASLPGYSRREHQIALAEQVETAIAGGTILLAQAGTGTGKSFALAIPAILSGRKTVVATPTKALQNQYIGDLTFIKEHLGADFTWAILKGRSNYPCFAKAKAIASPTAGQREILQAMEDNASPLEGQIIDRETFPLLPNEEWRDFSMSAAECPGAKSCPFSAQCFAERAKHRAEEAGIVITNLAYLLQDLKLRDATEGNVALLGEIEQLIIDEAHMLPDAVTSALEDTLGEGTYAVLARDLGGYLNDAERDPEIADGIERAARALWEELTNAHYRFAKGDPRMTDPMPLTVPQLIDADGLGGRFIALYQAIEDTRNEIKATKAYDDRERIRRERLLRRSANAMQRILDITTDPADKTVRWVEREERVIRGERTSRLFLRSAPIRVSDFLRKAVWDRMPAVLSSATLAAGTDFSSLMEILGLSRDEAATYDAGSPFDYPRQALLFIPDKGAPEPTPKTNAAWRVFAQTATQELVTKSGGGALLLFTSRSAMNESYEALATGFRAAGLTVLRQDGSTPAGELVRIMKEDGNAVLFALRTFFEGIDIQGRALRLVVLDKLPFAVPTDLVFQARCEDINRRHRDSWAWFNRLMIPSMILVLTQAFGRLIRHRDDLGVVAILDPRLKSKRYGAGILRALPPARQTTDIHEAAQFLAAAR